MAEAIGVAPIDESATAAVKWSYPWKEWARTPFVQWVLSPGTDFPIGGHATYRDAAKEMAVKVRVWANRNGLRSLTSIDDPEGLGRVTFTFYDGDGPRPTLLPFSGFVAVTQAAAAKDDAPRITCKICSAVQARPEHLLFIEECLIRNPNDSKDSSMYARHREDLSTGPQLRKVGMLTETWTLKDGPV